MRGVVRTIVSARAEAAVSRFLLAPATGLRLRLLPIRSRLRRPELCRPERHFDGTCLQVGTSL